MCIMASPVESVSGTKIFVGHDGKRQATVYSMAVELAGEGNAMILPVPVSSGQDIDLVDLSGTPEFFTPLVDMFTVRSRAISFGDDFLEVHRVGNYDVSIVATVSDVKRLNPNVFEVSSDTERTLREHYPGFAFLVAQLCNSGEFHPLAYIHPLMEGRLFVPTRHEHGDGSGLPKWDHQIFYQGNHDPDVLPKGPQGMSFHQTMDVEDPHTIRRLRYSLKPPALTLAAFLKAEEPMNRILCDGLLPNMDLTIRVI